jgi:hypothetical protein
MNTQFPIVVSMKATSCKNLFSNHFLLKSPKLLAMQGEFVVVCVVKLRRGGASIADSSQHKVNELILMS